MTFNHPTTALPLVRPQSNKELVLPPDEPEIFVARLFVANPGAVEVWTTQERALAWVAWRVWGRTDQWPDWFRVTPLTNYAWVNDSRNGCLLAMVTRQKLKGPRLITGGITDDGHSDVHDKHGAR